MSVVLSATAAWLPNFSASAAEAGVRASGRDSVLPPQAAREASRAAAADLQRQLEVGMATEVELMEARNNEARAELVAQQARTFQKLARLQWRFAAGKEMRF